MAIFWVTCLVRLRWLEKGSTKAYDYLKFTMNVRANIPVRQEPKDSCRTMCRSLSDRSFDTKASGNNISKPLWNKESILLCYNEAKSLLWKEEPKLLWDNEPKTPVGQQVKDSCETTSLNSDPRTSVKLRAKAPM